MPIFMECRHIKTNGNKCESPALRDGDFCYFHNRMRLAARQQRAAQHEPLELPTLEDNCAIQIALSKVICAIAAGTLDPRRAGMLLYGLQIASQNARLAGSSGYDPVEAVLYTDDGDELGPLQMRCEDEDGMDCEDCEDKECCDAIEEELWQAELKRFGEPSEDSSEAPSEEEIPQQQIEARLEAQPEAPIEGARLLLSRTACSHSCHAAPEPPCHAANLVTSIQSLTG